MNALYNNSAATEQGTDKWDDGNNLWSAMGKKVQKIRCNNVDIQHSLWIVTSCCVSSLWPQRNVIYSCSNSSYTLLLRGKWGLMN